MAAASQNKQADTPEIRALLELERRSLSGDSSITPEIKQQVDSKLKAYRAQGLVKPLKNADNEQALSNASDVFDSVTKAMNSIGPTTTGILGKIDSQIPGSSRKDLEGYINSLKANLAFSELQKMRDNSPTGGALGQVSEGEERLLSSTVADLDPNQSPKVLRENLQKIADHYSAYLQSLGYDKDQIGSVSHGLSFNAAAGSGGNNPPGGEGGQGGPNDVDPTPEGPASGPTKGVPDPKAAALITTLMRHGASNDEINQALQPLGVKASEDELNAAREGLQRSPNFTGDVPAIRQEPTTLGNRISASGLGAAGIAAGEAATGGRLDQIVGALGGNADQVRQASAVSQQAHPGAALVGSVLGSAPLVIGGEAALGGLGMAGSLGRSALVNGAYGALEGSGTDRQQPVVGAVLGGLTGAAGGAAGERVAQGVGRALAPTGGALAPLYAEGVRPTIGQRFSARGIGGGLLNTAEEALGSVPVIGAGIRGAREKARVQFQRGAFNIALREIGDQLPDDISHGTQAHAYTQDAFNRAYDEARSGMSFKPDLDYANDVAALRNDITTSGIYDQAQQKKIGDIINNAVVSRLQSSGGQLSGDAYKNATSAIDKAAQKLSSSDPIVSDALYQYSDILDSAARRSSSPDAVAAMEAADRGYAKLVRIELASKAAGGGDIGDFTPSQLNRAVQQATGGVRSRAYLRGDALMSDYAQAGLSLSDKLPNSGTVDRALLSTAATGGLGGLGYITPVGAALTGAAGSLYAPGVRDVVGAALAPRGGQTARTLRDFITTNPIALGTASGTGSGLLLQALPADQ